MTTTSTLDDIRLREYDLNNMPLLQRLRTDLLKQKAHVCIERAEHYTKYLRDIAPPNEPAEIRYANAAKYFLSHKKPLFFDDNLLAGTTATKPFAAPVYPEWTGLPIWPELDTISTRAANPQQLSREDAEKLNLDIFPFWMDKNILEHTRSREKAKGKENLKGMSLFERFVFFIAGKIGCISHTVPHYATALERGVNAIIEEAAFKEKETTDKQEQQFYHAVQIALEGITLYAANLAREAREKAEDEADQDRKKNFLAMAEVCEQVPAKPARTFREAVNGVWLIHIAIHAENINMAMSPGRLDQILYPYYKRDIDNGALTNKEALELLGCLWLKLNDNTNLVPETAEELFGGAGTVPAVTVGGVDQNGEDAVNELTYLMLRVTELLKTRDPSLNARYHSEKNSREYRDRVAEVIVNTKSVPAMHNDKVDIEVLKNQGVSEEHARDYAVIGCVELAASGRSYDASSSIMLNLASVLELALFNGTRPVTGNEQIGPKTGDPASFQTFDQFMDAFKEQFRWLAGHAIELNEQLGKSYQEICPSPMLSAFFEGPMEKGKDLIQGGAIYNSSGTTNIGFADTVDSLNAVEYAVFTEKKCTFAELIQALQDNFEGHEQLHAFLVHKAPKYGQQHPIAVKNSRALVKFIYDFYQGHTNYRGGKYKPGYWTMTNHAGQGKLCGALPNGRLKGKVFASGITPCSQAAANLPEALQSIGGLDPMCIPSGEALNLKYPEVRTPEEISRMGDAVETYFGFGGLHCQFNVMSYQDLIAAKNNPQANPELLVRVSGYSAYFNALNEAMKDEIITRTAYDIDSGQMVDFPEDHEDMLGFNKGKED